MQRRISEYVQWEAFESGLTNSHGNPVDGWKSAVEVGIYAFNPGTAEDVELAGHDRDIEMPSIYVPSGVVFGARDRVTVRGRLFEVDGATRMYRNPYGPGMDGNQINLKRVEG